MLVAQTSLTLRALITAAVLYEVGDRGAVKPSHYQTETLVAVTLSLPSHRQQFSISSKSKQFSFLRSIGAVQLEKTLETEAHICKVDERNAVLVA